MSKEAASSSAESSPEPVMLTEKKRKRNKTAPEEELEIDVNLPEPPSKKAKRAEKKKKEKSKNKKPTDESTDGGVAVPKEEAAPTEAKTVVESTKRSEYGIWIGNLPFAATKDSLRTFLLDHGNIEEQDITRLNMPGPMTKGPDRPGPKPQNRGFAYIDFTTQEILDAALALSEKLLVGRRVLIKNAKSFEGRPEKPKVDPAAEGAAADGAAPVRKEATKRVFVGNLSFDVTQEELFEHFKQAGEVEDVHMATFEDSGKCKGFAWVRFAEVESAEAAVRGFIFKDMNNEDDDDDEEEDEKDSSDSDAETKAPSKKKKKEKKRKWFINRIHARTLRCEFAEDAQTRYKKRFGKDAPSRNENRRDAPLVPGGNDAENVDFGGDAAGGRRPRLDKDQRQAERRAKHDARKVAPGKANANAQRATGAIVEGKGTKVTFD